jgi:hypothetical protein
MSRRFLLQIILFLVGCLTVWGCGKSPQRIPRASSDENEEEAEETISIEEARRRFASGRGPTQSESTAVGRSAPVADETEIPLSEALAQARKHDPRAPSQGVGGAVDDAQLDPPEPPATETESRQLTVRRLQRIAQALEAYREQNGNYPNPAIGSQLSWRVLILPWLGQRDLYGEFHKGESWDSEHNRALLDRIPAVYRAPHRRDTRTNYCLVTGVNTAFPTLEIVDATAFLDGVANTLLLAEVCDERAVPWTKPDDYHFAPALVQHDLFSLRRDGCFTIFGGATGVRLLPADASDETLLAIMTPGGKEGIDALDVTCDPDAEVDEQRIAAVAASPPERQFERRGPIPQDVGNVQADRFAEAEDGTLILGPHRPKKPVLMEDQRLPIPSAELLEPAFAALVEVYADIWPMGHKGVSSPRKRASSGAGLPRDDLSAGRPNTLRAARRVLGQRLLHDLDRFKDDASALYVVLNESRDAAAEGGDVETAVAAVTRLLDLFQLESIPLRLQTLERLNSNIEQEPSAVERLYREAIRLGDNALDGEDFNAAGAAYRLAGNSAKRSGSLKQARETRARSDALNETRKNYRQTLQSAELLLRDPADRKANTTVGRYYCLTKSDFVQGLPHLARGADGELKELAVEDLRSRRSAVDQLALADRWWSFAETLKSDLESRNARNRAREWYLVAAPRLGNGLDKSRAEKRIASDSADDSVHRGVESAMTIPRD